MNGTIDLSLVDKLEKLYVNQEMQGVYKTNLPLDNLFSSKHGISVASNIMVIGDPGIGKTTIMLDVLANAYMQNAKVLFVSAEMGKKQVATYVERFPHFKNVETIFMHDFVDLNTKDVLTQILNRGYNLVLIDSIVEVLEYVKEDANISMKNAEKWLIDLCRIHNVGNNNEKCFTTFLLIQQVTKHGNFVGTNKLKHLLDATLEIRKDETIKKTYLMFSKNRNGYTNNKMYFTLGNTTIKYNSYLPSTNNVDNIKKEKTTSTKELDVFLKKYS